MLDELFRLFFVVENLTDVEEFLLERVNRSPAYEHDIGWDSDIGDLGVALIGADAHKGNIGLLRNEGLNVEVVERTSVDDIVELRVHFEQLGKLLHGGLRDDLVGPAEDGHFVCGATVAGDGDALDALGNGELVSLGVDDDVACALRCRARCGARRACRTVA